MAQQNEQDQHILSQEQILHAQKVEAMSGSNTQTSHVQHELPDMSVGWYATPQNDKKEGSS